MKCMPRLRVYFGPPPTCTYSLLSSPPLTGSSYVQHTQPPNRIFTCFNSLNSYTTRWLSGIQTRYKQSKNVPISFRYGSRTSLNIVTSTSVVNKTKFNWQLKRDTCCLILIRSSFTRCSKLKLICLNTAELNFAATCSKLRSHAEHKHTESQYVHVCHESRKSAPYTCIYIIYNKYKITIA